MKSSAKTVTEYLRSLPEERREAIRAVREVILANLPKGYEEAMNWGMIVYQVPLSTYPDTYNGQPLGYAALASQKAYMAVYLSAIYADAAARARFERAYKATGKRFDVGQSCVRFRKLDDLPLELIGEAVGAIPLERFLAQYEQGRRGTSRAKQGGRTASPPASSKKARPVAKAKQPTGRRSTKKRS